MTPSEPTVSREPDPVCGMSVRRDVAIEDGLMVEHEGHPYYFCRAACRDAFVAAPADYVTSHRHPGDSAPGATPVIDDGMRRWYESCSCCLSDAYPEVKAALDAERAANRQPEVDPVRIVLPGGLQLGALSHPLAGGQLASRAQKAYDRSRES